MIPSFLVTVHSVHSNLVKIHSKSPSVMGFCPVCLGILPYSWQNTSRDITCEQLRMPTCIISYRSARQTTHHKIIYYNFTGCNTNSFTVSDCITTLYVLSFYSYKSSCSFTSLLSAMHCFKAMIIFSASSGFAR